MFPARPPAPVALLLAVAVLSLPGCGDDDSPTDPGSDDGITQADLVGNYTATVFETTDGSGTTDELEAGGTLQIALAADGTTTGRLFIPDGAEEGGDFHEALDGTWSFQAPSTVTLDMPSDTFVRDLTYTAKGMDAGGYFRLEAEGTFSDVTVRVLLQRRRTL